MSDVEVNDKLQLIINKFLCCVPVIDIDLKDCLSCISWNEQAILLDQTINNKIVKIYPIKTSYQRAFLKNIINILEKNLIEIHDNLYDAYCNLLSIDDNEKYYYKHYNIDKKIITLKENKNFISEGTTGLCSWQASLALSQWCLNNKNFIEKRTILELGSGVGLVGLATVFNCQPKAFYWSDCHPKVLSVLTDNIQLNIETEKNQTNTKNEKNTKQRFDLHTDSHTLQSNVLPTTKKAAEDFLTKSNTKDIDSICGNCEFGSNTIKETFVDCELRSNTNKVIFPNCEFGSNTINETFVDCELGSNTINETFADCELGSNTIKDTFRNTDSIIRVGDPSDGSYTIQKTFRIDSAKCIGDISCGSNTINETFRKSDSKKDISRGSCTINTKLSLNRKNLNNSIENCVDKSILFSSIYENTKVCVVNLPWESVQENQEYTKIRPDLILAADVVYDNSVFKPLCSAVKFFLDLNKKCVVIFACTERNSDTLQEFLQLLESNELCINQLTSPSPDKFFWSTAVSIRFYKITSK